MIRSFLLAISLCATVSIASAAPLLGMRPGEKFTYRVGFAIFPKAGEISIAAGEQRDAAGQPQLRMTTEISSRGLVRGLYSYDNKAECTIDLATGRLLRVKESGEDPKRATDSETNFDYEARLARHVDRSRPGRSVDVPIPPEGNPIDLITALVSTRDWTIKPGEKRDVVVFFGRDIYPLSIYAERYEEVRTPIGKFTTLLLVPRMDKDPKGLFKRGGEIKVWIAQDGSRLPVKMQLVLKYGTASLLMTQHTAAATEPVAAK